MGNYRNLTVEIDEGIALLTINRPQVLNALNIETLGELESAFLQLAADEEVKAIIVTGVGEKAFAAGADIRELTDLNALTGKDVSARGQQVMGTIENCPKPVIGALNGYCLGGGCELALACHLRIAAEEARIGLPETKLGLIPGYGATQRLPRLVGVGPALELILSGKMISAAEAYRLGLVNGVVPRSELANTARDLAKAIVANAPLAVRYAMEAVRSGMQMPLPEALSLESTLFGLCCSTADMKEGTTAFLEKKDPKFKGK
jgi:enoyl-CoA hydratase